MKSKLVFSHILTAFIIAAGCSPSATTLREGENVLAYGEAKNNEDGSIKIVFVDVLEDSLCAKGVQCIWAGRVQVLLEVAVGTEAQHVTLTLGTLLEGDTDTLNWAGFSITLVQVEPYPVISQQIHPQDYVITIAVEIE